MGFDADAFVREFLHPWNQHDVDGAVAMMTPDCVWEYPAGPEPFGTRFTGIAAVRRAVADVFERVPDIRYELVRYHAGEQHLVLELLVSGTQRDGTHLRFQACDVLTLERGKISAKRSYRKVVS
jgi:ketosteroid isomerase-like protein